MLKIKPPGRYRILFSVDRAAQSVRPAPDNIHPNLILNSLRSPLGSREAVNVGYDNIIQCDTTTHNPKLTDCILTKMRQQKGPAKLGLPFAPEIFESLR